MWVYCLEPFQSPDAHGAFCTNPSSSVTIVAARSTRSGVHHAVARMPARRPHGPPSAPAACAAVGSVRLGGTGAATPGSAPTRGTGSRIVTRSSWHGVPFDQPGLLREAAAAGAAVVDDEDGAGDDDEGGGQFGRMMPGVHVGLGFGLVVGGLVVGGADVVGGALEVD